MNGNVDARFARTGDYNLSPPPKMSSLSATRPRLLYNISHMNAHGTNLGSPRCRSAKATETQPSLGLGHMTSEGRELHRKTRNKFCGDKRTRSPEKMLKENIKIAGEIIKPPVDDGGGTA